MFNPRVRLLIPVALAALLAAGATGAAQSQRGSSPSDRQGQQAGGQQPGERQAGARGRAYFQGQVQSVHQQKLRGTDTRALAVTLRTTSGERFLVDLGPAAHFGRGDIEKGERIAVQGSFRRMGPRQVLFADRLWDDGRTIAIDRRARRQTGAEESAVQARRPQGGYPFRRTSREVTGTVEATKQVALRDGRGKNLLALVKTPKGRKCIVDLGPVEEVRALRVSRGDRITARGRDVQVNGRPVLIAFQLQADGETVGIDRSGQVYRSQARETPTGSRQQSD